MNKLEKYLLKWIAKRIIKQSAYHETNLIEYYQIIQDAMRGEFTEDNISTLTDFLRLTHQTALDQLWINTQNEGIWGCNCNCNYINNCGGKAHQNELPTLAHKEYLGTPICPLCHTPLLYNHKKNTMVCISCNGSRNANSEESPPQSPEFIHGVRRPIK